MRRIIRSPTLSHLTKQAYDSDATQQFIQKYLTREVAKAITVFEGEGFSSSQASNIILEGLHNKLEAMSVSRRQCGGVERWGNRLDVTRDSDAEVINKIELDATLMLIEHMDNR